jgi:hypothetical protein
VGRRDIRFPASSGVHIDAGGYGRDCVSDAVLVLTSSAEDNYHEGDNLEMLTDDSPCCLNCVDWVRVGRSKRFKCRLGVERVSAGAGLCSKFRTPAMVPIVGEVVNARSAQQPTTMRLRYMFPRTHPQPKRPFPKGDD